MTLGLIEHSWLKGIVINRLSKCWIKQVKFPFLNVLVRRRSFVLQLKEITCLTIWCSHWSSHTLVNRGKSTHKCIKTHDLIEKVRLHHQPTCHTYHPHLEMEKKNIPMGIHRIKIKSLDDTRARGYPYRLTNYKNYLNI